MQTLDLIAVLTVLTAAFGYVNVRLLKLPPTIGLMVLTLVFSMILLAIGRFLPAVERRGPARGRAVRLRPGAPARDAGLLALRRARCTST